jgi:hypothetical protein
MSVAQSATDDQATYVTYLDRRTKLSSPTYDNEADETTFTLPYKTNAFSTFICASQVPQDPDHPPGFVLTPVLPPLTTILPPGRTTLTFKGAWLLCPVWYGFSYSTEYQLSPPMIRLDGNGGQSAMNYGRIEVSTISIRYEITGSFGVNHPVGSYETQVSGRILGAPSNVLGAPPISSGIATIPMRVTNTNCTPLIRATGHLPMWLLNIDWEGTHTQTARRI